MRGWRNCFPTRFHHQICVAKYLAASFTKINAKCSAPELFCGSEHASVQSTMQNSTWSENSNSEKAFLNSKIRTIFFRAHRKVLAVLAASAVLRKVNTEQTGLRLNVDAFGKRKTNFLSRIWRRNIFASSRPRLPWATFKHVWTKAGLESETTDSLLKLIDARSFALCKRVFKEGEVWKVGDFGRERT